MSEPSREEVEAFIAALNYGMKVSHKPEFLIALAEGWLDNNKKQVAVCKKDFDKIRAECDHDLEISRQPGQLEITTCRRCGLYKERP